MPLKPWLVAVTALAFGSAPDGEEAKFARAREEMVATQVAARGVRDPKTLAAMRKVARHLFVPPAVVSQAYDDHPLGIGHGQTISQPYIVGFMTEALGLRGGETVLEVVFAYKGRLYFRKREDRRVEVVAIGTKNTQERELEFLASL